MSYHLRSPYSTHGCVWLRGNLHTHTTNSDGALSPVDTIGRYAELGYDFLGLSDHEVLTAVAPLQSITSMTLIPCSEIGGGPHVLAVNIGEPIGPDTDRQTIIDAIRTAGGVAVLNHPNWERAFSHWPPGMMEAMQGYVGIEIYNGVVEWLPGSALALDRWDALLSSGRAVWGFAHDDTHFPTNIGSGWLMVQSADPSAAAIVDAIVRGAFISSTGVTVESVAVDGPIVAVVAPDADRIRFVGEWGRLLQQTEGGSASYEVAASSGPYVRVECLGRGGRAAWTQPIAVVAA